MDRRTHGVTFLLLEAADFQLPLKNTYKSAQNSHIGMKLSKYDHTGYLISLKRPTLTWSNLCSFVMTYHHHGHPIKTNPYKLVQNSDIDIKLSEYDLGYLISLGRPTLTWSNLTSFVMTYLDHSHPIETNTYNSAKI